MNTDTWIPDGLDLERHNQARVYDYMLGGYHNFEVDRVMAKKVLEIYPDSRLAAQAGRAFLRRVVNFLAEQDIEERL